MIAYLLSALALCATAQTDAAAVGDVLEDLGNSDPAVVERAYLDLAERGAEIAEFVLDGFEAAPARARLARAELLRAHGGKEQIEAAARFVDSDARVRGVFLGFLSRADHGAFALKVRVAAIGEVARSDPERGLRRRALRALGELDESLAVDELVLLMRELPRGERGEAARALPITSRSWEAVRALVHAGFRTPARRGAGLERTPGDLLAALLPIYGRLLADRPTGGEHARDRAPLVLGLRYPSVAVQLAAEEAFDQLLGRLRELDQAERGMRVLEGLEEQGLDHRLVEYHRSRLAFWPGADPPAAFEAARRIQSAESVGRDPESRNWLYRALHLQGVALIAMGKFEEAKPTLIEAGAVLDGLLAERSDRFDGARRAQHARALDARALVEIALVVLELARGVLPNDRELLRHARAAHLHALEAQLSATQDGGEVMSSWDALLGSDLSVYRLLFTGVDLPALPLARGLELQEALGRVLATVSPLEVPGFEPARGFADLGDPFEDPRRFALLRELYEAAFEGVSDQLIEVLTRIGRMGQGEVPAAEDEALRMSLERQYRWMQDRLLRMEEDGFEDLRALRLPSELALWYARDLRNEGRPIESREVAQRMLTDLLATKTLIRLPWTMEAELEMAIGNTWTDQDEPRRAEEELLRAVERLEEIESRMSEEGATWRQLAAVRATRCNALVSLAVNANVKLGDKEQALEYFEQAYELRRDDFMRVLLACYRARSGRGDEARALLRELRPSPNVTYNMACTYALLGEKERALELLELEFEEYYPSEASRARQKEWAKGDPDLASLRDDPRFERLVGGG